MLIYLLCYFYVFLGALLDFMNFKLDNSINKSWWTRMLKIIFVCQGYFMVLLRCTEPAFIEVNKNYIVRFWRFITCKSCKKPNKQVNITNSPSEFVQNTKQVPQKQDLAVEMLYVRLASAMSVELVYIILKCITQFSYITFDDDTY
jgi:hypothetical protein